MRRFYVVLALALMSVTFVATPASAKNRPAVPISHRQKATDIPQDAGKRGDAIVSDIDRRLDQKLRGICRGC